ncbi:MAG: hypothetical protein NTW46_00165 [Candidatus Nealsonbacteria bacterium]|nr:hypothetical protein [Candidatus Nealsonbacteria bacterium]
MSIEKEIAPQQDNWIEYEHSLLECVENNDPNQLEHLLMEDHPVLPGELEAYEWLVENLHRKPMVGLDKTGYHVIKIESGNE